MPSIVAAPSTAHVGANGPKTRPFRHGMSSGASARPTFAPGTIVGDRYRVVALLGEGGMGQVYEAEHVQLPRRVALKVLKPERADDDALARFRQEAKATARIGHPGIVTVVDFDTLADGTLFLAMELLCGQSLEDWLCAPGRLSDGVAWLAVVARALHAAHAAAIVHRDLKPANIFLHHGILGIEPKILDFGIAKVTAADATQIATQAGTLLGTPYYLAPERALGQPLQPRSDLYSLGVILYEMLVGTVPFQDDTFMGVLAQHIRTPALDPRQAAPERDLPASTCAFAMRLLEKDPSRRPAHALDVAEALERLLVHDRDALQAVVTGPRELTTAGLPTVHLQDVAERPTTPPAQHAFASVVDRPTMRPAAAQRGPSAHASAVTRAASRSTGASWVAYVVGGVAALVVGGGLVWVLAVRPEATGAAVPPAPTPATVAPAVVGAPEPTPIEPAHEPAPQPPGSSPHDAAAEAADSTAVPAAPPTADPVNPPKGDDTTEPATRPRPRARRPRAGQPADAPAAPAIKDDVYDD